VSVAKQFELENQFKNIGSEMVKEVAINTNKLVGDGTTTATVLANAILNEGFKDIKSGAEPIDIKRDLDECLKYTLKELDKHSIDIKDDYKSLLNVAKISTNNDLELAKIIINLLKQTNNSKIILEKSKTSKTYTEFIDGMSFNSTYVDSNFITDINKNTCNLEDSVYVIYSGKINNPRHLIRAIELAKQNNKSLVIIAESVSNNVILTMLANKNNNGLQSVIINSPGYGPGRKQHLEDIAIFTGGQVIQEGKLQSITKEQLGESKGIIVTDEKTIIKEGNATKDSLDRKIKSLQHIKDKYEDYDKNKIEERISKFKGGIGVIYVGAASELEWKEKYDRVEDAVNAVQAALEEGIIPGGGTTLYEIANEAGSQTLLDKALEAPYKTIKRNGGIKKYDSSKDYQNFLKKGIIDPKKVTRVALENAVSVAGTILTTETLIIDEA